MAGFQLAFLTLTMTSGSFPVFGDVRSGRRHIPVGALPLAPVLELVEERSFPFG